MSLFRLPKRRKSQKNDRRKISGLGPAVDNKGFRHLRIDALEERQLLTVAILDTQDVVVSQENGYSQHTTAARALAGNHDGDFVVVWSRTDMPVDPVTHETKADPNIYARYFTDEVERLTLPKSMVEGGTGYLTLEYAGNEGEVQKLTVNAGGQPMSNIQTWSGDLETTAAGYFALEFNGQRTGQIAFNEGDPATSANNIQQALRNLGQNNPAANALRGIVVQSIDGNQYLMHFAQPGVNQTDVIHLAAGSMSLSGFYPAVVGSVEKEPLALGDSNDPINTGVPIVPASQDPDGRINALHIQEWFQHQVVDYYSAPFQFYTRSTTGSGSATQLGPATQPLDIRTYPVEVEVTPVPGLHADDPMMFDVRFVGQSGKKDLSYTDANGVTYPALRVTGAFTGSGENETAGASVRIIKKTSDEFRVNAPEPNDPVTGRLRKFDQINPGVAMDTDGDFMITWESEVPDDVTYGSVTDIFARRFSPLGFIDSPDALEASQQYLVTQVVDPATHQPVTDKDGNIIVRPIQGVRPLGGDFRVNSFTANAQIEPSVSCDDSGNFVVTWSSVGQTVSNFNGVYGQRYNREGQRLSDDFRIDTRTGAPTTEDTNEHRWSYVASSPDGHFAVVWEILPYPGATVMVAGRVFAANGRAITEPFNIVGNGEFPTATWDSSNRRILVGWDQYRDADNSGIASYGVYAREYAFTEPTSPTQMIGLTTIRDTFRANSPSLNTAGYPNTDWWGTQAGNQVAMDADGDMTVSYGGALRPPDYQRDRVPEPDTQGQLVRGSDLFRANDVWATRAPGPTYYPGRGPDTSVNIAIPASFWAAYIPGPNNINADLLPWFPDNIYGPQIGYLPPAMATNGDVDGAADQLMIWAHNTGATDEQVGRLRVIYEEIAGLMRGDSTGVFLSQFDSNPTAPNEVPMVTNADLLFNNTRDGRNDRDFFTLDETSVSGSVNFTLRIPIKDGTVVVAPAVTAALATYTPPVDTSYDNLSPPPRLDTAATAVNIHNAITSVQLLGRNWPEGTSEGPLDSAPPPAGYGVRVANDVIGIPETGRAPISAEFAEREDTAWDLSNANPNITQNDFAFELTYQGEVHDRSVMTSSAGTVLQRPIPEEQTLTMHFGGQGNLYTLVIGNARSDDLMWSATDRIYLANEIRRMGYIAAKVFDVPQTAPADPDIKIFRIVFDNPDWGRNIPEVEIRLPSNPFPPPGTPDYLMPAYFLAPTRAIQTPGTGVTPAAPAPITIQHTGAWEGTDQYNLGLSMEPDGDFVGAWTSTNSVTGASTIMYRRWQENTDTAGPIVTDFILPDGRRLVDGGQVEEPLDHMVVTFDEEMMSWLQDLNRVGPERTVEDPANWALMRDGVEILGGIRKIDFGMNRSVDLVAKQSEIQHFNFYGTAGMTGDYSISFRGIPSAAIHFDGGDLATSAQNLQEALAKMSIAADVSVQDVVTGPPYEDQEVQPGETPRPYPPIYQFKITFLGESAGINQPLLMQASVGGGITSVDSDEVVAGWSPAGTNKWEAVVWFDANGTSVDPPSGAPKLTDGHYQLVAKNSLVDKSGNPLGRTGFLTDAAGTLFGNPDGYSFTRDFQIKIPTGTETRVNSRTPGNQPTNFSTDYNTQRQSPKQVADDGRGDFVAAWTSDAAGEQGIYVKLYTVDTSRPPQVVSQLEIPVVRNSNLEFTYASVAMDEDGDFVVTWSQNDPTNTVQSWDVWARRYDSSGAPITAPFLVNTETVGAQRNSSVAMDTNGDYVITWQSADQDGSGYGIYAQRYAPNDATLGGFNEVQRLTLPKALSSDPSLPPTVRADRTQPATFALEWGGRQTAPIELGGSSFALAPVIQQRLRDIGASVTVEAISQNVIDIRFVGTAGSRNVEMIEVVDETNIRPGARVTLVTVSEGSSGEFRVNETLVGNQTWPDISMDPQGSFVITWTSSENNQQTPYLTNIMARKFQPNSTLRGFTSADEEVDERVRTDGSVITPLLVTADNPQNHVVARGTGRDGVVRLISDRTDGTFLGTGTLLTSRRHILTAAHIVCDQFGNMNTRSVNVTFEMAAGDVSVDASTIYVLPGYTGVVGNGYDLAIIALPTGFTAPAAAEARDIYRGTGEINQPFTKIGYGASGQGTTGSTLPSGTKREGGNLYEFLDDRIGGLGDSLIYDFDSGQAANDAFGALFGKADLGRGTTVESMGAPGDSGGPNLIGNVVAGVTSYITSAPGPWDVSPGTDSSFGDIGADVRVSLYSSWVDSVLKGGGGEFIVNNTLNQSQKWSSVAMDSRGDFVIAWTSYGQDIVGNSYGAGTNGENGVYARRFNADTTAVRPEWQVNTTAASNQQNPSVAMNAAGDFVITWESYQDRPDAPWSDGSHLDQPNSFGIMAQRYVRRSDMANGSLIGPNGEIGAETHVNTTLAGDQRWPSVAMDDTGDYVIVWSGNGTQLGQADTQGLFYQRYTEPYDTAGPMVAAVLNPQAIGGMTQILEKDIIRLGTNSNAVRSLIVTFSEDVLETGGNDGINSVLNPSRWALTYNGRQIRDAVMSVERSAAPPGKVAYLLNLDFDPNTPWDPSSGTNTTGDPMFGREALAAGKYILTVYDEIRDLSNNALDGDSNGLPGGDFNRSFSIVSGDAPAGPNGPGTPTPEMTDIPVNLTTANNQIQPAIAANNKGDYVVVWTSYGQTGDAATDGNIIGQRFNLVGNKIGSEFMINTTRAGNQSEPSVAMDTSGNFVVVWSGNGVGDNQGIFARRYDPEGNPLDEQEFRVNSWTFDAQRSPTVGIDAQERFVIAWTSAGQSPDPAGIYARRYDFNGNDIDPAEFLVNTTIPGEQKDPSIGVDGDGNFVVVWSSISQDEFGWGIYGRRFNANGTPATSEFRVNSFGGTDQCDPKIAMDTQGDFVVTWTSFGQDGSGYGVYARRFDRSTAPRDANDIQVNLTTANYQMWSSVAMTQNGDFVITWQSAGQEAYMTNDYGIYARVFNADGTSKDLGPDVPTEWRVNATTAYDQTNPAVAMDPRGNFAIVWVTPDTFNTATPRAPTSSGLAARFVGMAQREATSTFDLAASPNAQIQPNLTGVSYPSLFNPSASTFFLKNSDGSGPADNAFNYGVAGLGWQALMGDWDGDGVDTPGMYDPATGNFYLRNYHAAGPADIMFNYGPGGLGWKPLVGDWDGDGKDSIGLYEPATGLFFLKNSFTAGPADTAFVYGMGSMGWQPIAGDWDGDGIDTVGMYVPSSAMFFLRNEHASGPADISFVYGVGGLGWQPLTGSWGGSGRDTVGLYAPDSSTFFLKNTHSSGAADRTFQYGVGGMGWQPLMGDWLQEKVSYLRVGLPAPEGAQADPIVVDQIAPIANAVLDRWQAAGVDPSVLANLRQTEWVVGDLPGDLLAKSTRGLVQIDRDAEGWGWFVDDTPATAEEFAPAQNGSAQAIDPRAMEHIDLESVVEHELGHLVGLTDVQGTVDGLMANRLGAGVRRSLGADELAAVFGSSDLLD